MIPLKHPPLISNLKQVARHWQRQVTRVAVAGVAAGLGLTLILPGVAQSPVRTAIANKQTPTKAKVIRIGYQKSGTWLLLKARGSLEKRLAPLGVAVKWNEFTAGVPLMEALNAGSLDIGHSGDAPAIFAQAAGAPLVYFANSRPSPESVAILVPKNSPIHRVADLRGKRLAFGKGSSAHPFVVQALKRAGLQLQDVKPVYLNPPDGRLAFERGNVDAWAVWDPFFASAQRSSGARILVDGKGLTPFREFYLANRSFASNNPGLIQAVIQETDKVGDWALKHPSAAAKFFSTETKLDLATVEQAERRRRRYGAQVVQTSIVREQQQIADTFKSLGLIPKPVTVSDVVWRPR